MFAVTKLATVFTVVAAAAAATFAAPATVFNPSGLNTDIAYSPSISTPSAGAIWTVGSLQTVTWDTTSIPAEAANQTGLVLLGYMEDGDESEHLDISHPLASNFPIMAGTVSVTVPTVDPRQDYVVVLFGDSGNVSQKFTITSA